MGGSETTVVEIRKLRKQIEGYLKKSGKQILQSVGCYQLEALGPQIIKDIKGDFFNVMGLPLFKLLNTFLMNNEKIFVIGNKVSKFTNNF